VLSVDLYLGEGRLVKAGAAPSFVVRDGSLFAVRACGTPLGCGGGAERTVVELGDGASVIMFSDGIAPAAEEAVWLVEEAARGGCLSALDRAERILALAKEHTGNRDDMTVTVVRVFRNE
jgi:stage II sporulation protein E